MITVYRAGGGYVAFGQFRRLRVKAWGSSRKVARERCEFLLRGRRL